MTVADVAAPDIFRAPNIEGEQHAVTFRNADNPIAGKVIIEVEPSYSAARLDDGSAFHLIRDHRRDGAIVGIRHVSWAGCWPDRFAFKRGYEEGASREIVLSDTPGRARHLLRLENDNGRGRISVVWQRSDSAEERDERASDLIISKRPFHGFGVGPPSIEGGVQSLLTITQNNDGSLIVGSYSYAIREENVPFDLLHRSGE